METTSTTPPYSQSSNFAWAQHPSDHVERSGPALSISAWKRKLNLSLEMITSFYRIGQIYSHPQSHSPLLQISPLGYRTSRHAAMLIPPTWKDFQYTGAI